MRTTVFLIFICVIAGFNCVLSQSSCQKPAAEKTIDRRPQSQQLSISSTSDPRKWIAPSYLGLKLGESKEADVKKLFGEPIWQGLNAEKVFVDDAEPEKLIQYNHIKGSGNNIDIVVGEKTGLVKAIAVYPDLRQTTEEITAAYGAEYYVTESWESMCVGPEKNIGKWPENPKYPISIIYPQLGMYILLGDDHRVIHIGFMMKCA